MRLEVLSRSASGPEKPPLLFVHGAYVGAWCWEDHFLPWFAAQGHPAYALSLRGHGASEGRDRLDDFGLTDYACDVADAVKGIGRPAVLVGHSMGALVVQKFLEGGGEAPAVVLACAVPAFGLVPATIALAWTRPALFAGIQGMAAGRGASTEVVAEAMFAGPMDAERVKRVRGRMQRESRRALLDMSGWGLPQAWRTRMPRMLVLDAARDALIPRFHTQSTAMMLGAEYRLLEGLGHAIMLDAHWERAAQAIHDWI